MSTSKDLVLFDTTLRDGAQMEGLALTVDDKLRIAQKIDELGVQYIEGGWPGSNPKDEEFYARAPNELRLKHAKLVTFSSTRRAGTTAGKDPNLRITVGASTPVVCIVGKSWDLHVREALRTTLDENIKMVADTVKYLKRHFDEVFFDAEHFFDGFKHNPEYAMRVLEAAAGNGADCLVLCDTNGGCLPGEVREIVAQVHGAVGTPLGIHCHNDADCAVANSLAAVEAGAVHVQGAMNGYGERCGNANLASIAANLVLKLGSDVITREQLGRLGEVAHFVAEVANRTPNPQQPYVGSSAFAHKAGLHASAVARRRDLYEHVDPSLVGNVRHLVVSELAGRATILVKAGELGVDLGEGDRTISGVIRRVKELEHLGYHFEAADGSFELLLRRAAGWEQEFFSIESFRVIVETDGAGGISSEATVKLHADGKRFISTAEGNGPVNALDAALRKALVASFPELDRIHLADYKVRLLNENVGTGATTRVLVESTDGEKEWATIGVSENIIEASWEALLDGYVYGLLHQPR
ncbi:MAG TPA: citramalate synthase [Actinomycetota bacterium]|jgi:2-isopropylmalate synthase|nr:citramalate synthase [Actinomycetota bacterium]